MKKVIYLLSIVTLGYVMHSCFKVDDMVFLGDEIEEYKFNDYDGEPEFDLESQYLIPDSLINLFTVESQVEGEDESATIYAVYVGEINNIDPTDTVIVYCHGQSLHLDVYWPRISLLANVGGKGHYDVLAMDYRGFGLSEGKSSEDRMYADVEACLDWLKDQGVPASNVIIYGYSLGTAPATHMAANNEDYLPSKLILESPMASAQNLAEESILINFQSSFISSLEFDNIEKIKEVEQPFMLMHGAADDYLPASNGEAIFDNYSGAYGEEHIIPEATHSGKTGVVGTLGQSTYIEMVDAFIKK